MSLSSGGLCMMLMPLLPLPGMYCSPHFQAAKITSLIYPPALLEPWLVNISPEIL